MTNTHNLALNFTCKLIKKNQLRSGVWQVQIEVLPEDMPNEFLTAAPESEWMIATVRQDENGAPQEPSQPEDKKARQTIWEMAPPAQAALLGDRMDFQGFITRRTSYIAEDDVSAKEALYKEFNITSRSQLVNPDVEPHWKQFVREFRSELEQGRYGDNFR